MVKVFKPISSYNPKYIVPSENISTIAKTVQTTPLTVGDILKNMTIFSLVDGGGTSVTAATAGYLISIFDTDINTYFQMGIGLGGSRTYDIYIDTHDLYQFQATYLAYSYSHAVANGTHTITLSGSTDNFTYRDFGTVTVSGSTGGADTANNLIGGVFSYRYLRIRTYMNSTAGVAVNLRFLLPSLL